MPGNDQNRSSFIYRQIILFCDGYIHETLSSYESDLDFRIFIIAVNSFNSSIEFITLYCMLTYDSVIISIGYINIC